MKKKKTDETEKQEWYPPVMKRVREFEEKFPAPQLRFPNSEGLKLWKEIREFFGDSVEAARKEGIDDALKSSG